MSARGAGNPSDPVPLSERKLLPWSRLTLTPALQAAEKCQVCVHAHAFTCVHVCVHAVSMCVCAK